MLLFHGHAPARYTSCECHIGRQSETRFKYHHGTHQTQKDTVTTKPGPMSHQASTETPQNIESAHPDKEPATGASHPISKHFTDEASAQTVSDGNKQRDSQPWDSPLCQKTPPTAQDTSAKYTLMPLFSRETKTNGSNASNEHGTKRVEQLLTAIDRNKSEPIKNEEHFSFSQLNTYFRCPKQYEYSYVKGIKMPPNLPMSSGKAIHETFELNSKHKMSKKEDMPIDSMLDAAATAHDKYMADVDDTPKNKGEDKDANIAIAGYYRRTQAPGIMPIAVERGFRIELEDDEAATDYRPVIGWIDTFSELPDPREGPTQGQRIVALEDYKRIKKGGRRRGQLEIDLSPQLTLYDYVYNLQTEGMTTDVVGYRQLGYNGPRAQEPGPYSTPIYRNAAGMKPEARQNRWRRVLNQMKQVQRLIRGGEFVATDNPMTCSWCGYRDICQSKPEA